jgi:hypothetical protein
VVDVSKTFKGQKNAVFSTGSKFGGKKSMPALVAIFLGLLLLAAGVFNLYTWLNPAKAAQEAPLVIDDGY